MEYGTNVDLGTITIPFIPRVGEFLINDEGIKEDWKSRFYVVRAVTYTAGGHVVIHIERQDVDAIKKHEEEIKEKLSKLIKKGTENE